MTTFLLGTGWGATPPTLLTAGTGDVAVRQIISPTGGRVVISRINVAAIQMSGVLKNPSYTAFYLLSGGQGSAAAVQGIPPASTDLFGFPTQKQVADAGLQWEGGFYQNVQAQDDGVAFARGSLFVTGGRILYVCTPGIVDGSTNTPVIIGGPVSIMVRGWDDENVINAKLR